MTTFEVVAFLFCSVAGFWSSRLEEGEQVPWSATAFISATEREGQKQGQNGGNICSKMAPAVSLPPTFPTRGSYRRHMNHLIRSNSSEKLNVNPSIKSGNIPAMVSKHPELRDSFCSAYSTKRNIETTGTTTNNVRNDYNLNLCSADSLSVKQPVTAVPGGDHKNYIVSNRLYNSRTGHHKSLVSLSPRVASGMTGPELQTNGVETDGGVVVGNKGDASFRSSRHPSASGRGTAHQSDAEVGETLSRYEKCSMKEINKARQRKTGAIAAGGLSYSAGAKPEVVDRTEQTSAVLRFPCVEKLIHKYTVLIAEHKERALAEKQAGIQIRPKEKQGNTENHCSRQRRELSSSSAKRKTVELQQKHSSEHVERGPKGQGTSGCSDLSGGLGVSEHLQYREYVIDSTQQSDGHEGSTEHLTKRLQQYPNEPVNNSTGQLKINEFINITKLNKEVDVKCRSEHPRINLHCSDIRVTKNLDERGDSSVDSAEHLKQMNACDRSIVHTNTHPQEEIKEDSVYIAQSQQRNNDVGEESNQLQQVCPGNNKELEQTNDSLTSMFIKPSVDVTRNISHVGGTKISASGDEGRHKLMLPSSSKRSASPASDEGCSVVSPPESSLTPCSSEDDIVRSLVEKSNARWTWPPASNDQDSDFQGQVNRHEYGRCISSDSAVCLLPSDDERMRMKDPRIQRREKNIDRKILDFASAEDSPCDKAMVFDPNVNKESGIVFDFDSLKYMWRYEPRKDSVSRQSSVDSTNNGDSWFEEMRNHTKETVFDDVSDSDAERERFLASAGDFCWDRSSVETKTIGSDLDDDRNRVPSFANYGYPCRYRPRQFRKLTSMISCESGVVEDEVSSRKNSTTEGGDNPDDDEYLVELRRQSAQSFQTDDDESNSNPQYRYWRTPSVVVSDYSDDVPCFTSVTLEELDQLKDVSCSECTSAASSVSGSVSVVDTEYALRTPERKASDCSTCSTLSGDEDVSCDALLQPVRTTQKVGEKVCFVGSVFRTSSNLLIREWRGRY